MWNFWNKSWSRKISSSLCGLWLAGLRFGEICRQMLSVPAHQAYQQPSRLCAFCRCSQMHFCKALCSCPLMMFRRPVGDFVWGCWSIRYVARRCYPDRTRFLKISFTMTSRHLQATHFWVPHWTLTSFHPKSLNSLEKRLLIAKTNSSQKASTQDNYG